MSLLIGFKTNGVPSAGLRSKVVAIERAAQRSGWEIQDLDIDVSGRRISMDARRCDGRRFALRGTFDLAVLERSKDREVQLSAGVRGPYPTVDIRRDHLGRSFGHARDLLTEAARYILDNPFLQAQIAAVPARALDVGGEDDSV